MEYMSILVFVIGIIFSFLSKDKKEKKQTKPVPKNKKKSVMPNYKEIIMEKLEELEPKVIKKTEPVHPEIEKLKAEKANLEYRIKKLEANARTTTTAPVALNSEKKDTRWSKEKIVDGIIMSEVLAKPRVRYSYIEQRNKRR